MPQEIFYSIYSTNGICARDGCNRDARARDLEKSRMLVDRGIGGPPPRRRRCKNVMSNATTNAKRMSMIVSKGTLDWAYPPFILATTAAAMNLDVTMFFTFYGLTLLKKKLDLHVSPLGNPAMEMPMLGMHVGMPNIVAAIPGVDAAATAMMKNLIKKKGIASIEELRSMAIEADVKMIACQMTMDLFEYSKEDLIEGPVLGGAATYIETASKSDINLFI
jgi:peroxiredoxin family protein